MPAPFEIVIKRIMHVPARLRNRSSNLYFVETMVSDCRFIDGFPFEDSFSNREASFLPAASLFSGRAVSNYRFISSI